MQQYPETDRNGKFVAPGDRVKFRLRSGRSRAVGSYWFTGEGVLVRSRFSSVIVQGISYDIPLAVKTDTGVQYSVNPKDIVKIESVARTVAHLLWEAVLPVDWRELNLNGLRDLMKQSGCKDLCKIRPPVCRGNLGIDRKEMPQFPGEHAEDLLNGLKEKGIAVVGAEIPVGELKASQDEINAVKAIHAAEALLDGSFKASSPVLVSSDNYILDGHHRWAAQWLLDKNSKLPVVQIDMLMEQLLDFSEEYTGRKKGFEEAGRIVRSLLALSM